MGRGTQNRVASLLRRGPGRVTTLPESTNHLTLDELGIDRAWLEGLESREPIRASSVAWFETPDGDPIVGLTYRCDFRAEEEYGIGKLAQAITGASDRNFQMTEEGRKHVGWFSDVNGLVLSVEPLAKQEFVWGEELRDRFGWAGDEAPAYAKEFPLQVGAVQRIEPKVDRWMTIEQLKDVGRQLGLTQMPRKKDDLYQAVAQAARENGKAENPNSWPTWFENGKTMVFRADGDEPAARVLRRLIKAAQEGYLAIGNGSSNPFGHGLMFFDARDETDGTRQQVAEQFAWYDEQMSKLQPLLDELALHGYVWYFAGNPTVLDTGDGEKKIRYWLNGLRPAEYYDQRRLPEGAVVDPEAAELFKRGGARPLANWFTLEQLTPEAVLEQARASAAK